ncbi:unnamed protein product [Miscanthus lutarioriparius]|uniref:Uncharacterized protein n=1 Tax=Miscanthus lutarioriparius TaxID=422564 RepID=A0A811RSF9_9POAL|nr:unnamed protein product [Miscanthus lutarioriparius]
MEWKVLGRESNARWAASRMQPKKIIGAWGITAPPLTLDLRPCLFPRRLRGSSRRLRCAQTCLMAAALRGLLRQRTGSIPVTSPAMLLLVRCCSTAPTQPAAASSQECCYALGAFGKMQFSRQQFIPFDSYMKENENSILEPVPMDRLISPVDEDFNYFTAESAKNLSDLGI